MYYGTQAGVLPETVGNNDLGNPKRNTLADGGGVILPGVTANKAPNTKRIAYANNTVLLPQSEFVYDASFVKLREANITYTIPSRWLTGVQKYIKGIDVSLIGRNLWLIHKNLPYADPEETLSAGNVQGNQSGAYPTSRIVGFNVKVKL
jgi:hypothetical protein